MKGITVECILAAGVYVALLLVAVALTAAGLRLFFGLNGGSDGEDDREG